MEKYLVVIDDMVIDSPYDSFDTATKYCNTEIDNDTNPNEIIIYEITNIYESKIDYSWVSKTSKK